MDLIKNSLNGLKEKLSELPAYIYYEYDNYLVIFSVKEIDEENYALTVGICKKETDVLFSNLVKSGTIKEIELYLGESECVLKVSKYIDNLIKKVQEHEV